MMTSVLCFLAVLLLATVGNARYTTSVPGISKEDKTTLQLESGTLRPRGAEAVGVEGADALGNALRQAAQGLLRVQGALEQQLQQRDEALRNDLDQRIQQVEQRLGVLEEPTKTDGAAAAEVQLLVNKVDNRVIQLEAIVQRVLEKLLPDTLEEQLAKPSSQLNDSDSTLISTSSTPTSVSTSIFTSTPISSVFPPIPTSPSSSTAPQPAVTITTGPTTSGGAAADDVESERRKMEIRVQEAKAKMERARAAPSKLGEDLCTAASEERLADVRRLLDAGADVKYVSSKGRTPLTAAFNRKHRWKSGDADIVWLLLEKGADVNAYDAYGITALHIAAAYDPSGRCLGDLIAAGADVNARDSIGCTPLHRAAKLLNAANIRSLLAAGARKDVRCWSEWEENMTPFDLAQNDILNLLRP